MIRERYFKELGIVLQKEGFTPLPEQEQRLPVAWKGRHLCWITETGGVRYVPQDVNTIEAEHEFVKAVIGHSQQAEATDRKLKEKELKALQARDEELDGLFERIYEDNVSGKLSDDRFARMSRRYEEEQKELAEKIKALRAEIDKQSSQSMTTDMFISLVRKYTRARKLTPRMLNELIEKIEVFNAEKIDGVWEQRLRIHYNCVGVIEIPELIPLPAPEVSVNTRKGVVVNYAPSTIAG